MSDQSILNLVWDKDIESIKKYFEDLQKAEPYSLRKSSGGLRAIISYGNMEMLQAALEVIPKDKYFDVFTTHSEYGATPLHNVVPKFRDNDEHKAFREKALILMLNHLPPEKRSEALKVENKDYETVLRFVFRMKDEAFLNKVLDTIPVEKGRKAYDMDPELLLKSLLLLPDGTANSGAYNDDTSATYLLAFNQYSAVEMLEFMGNNNMRNRPSMGAFLKKETGKNVGPRDPGLDELVSQLGEKYSKFKEVSDGALQETKVYISQLKEYGLVK